MSRTGHKIDSTWFFRAVIPNGIYFTCSVLPDLSHLKRISKNIN